MFIRNLILGLFFTLPALAQNIAEWNVLFYLNGKNNLQHEMQDFLLKRLYQMEGETTKGHITVNLPKKINILIEYGTLKARCQAESKIDHDLDLCRQGTKRFRLIPRNNQINSQASAFQYLGKTDMGDYRSLVNFVAWSKKNFPAKRTILYIFNHGDSYKNARSGVFSFDDETGNSINPHELAIGFSKIKSILQKPVDLFLTDMCVIGAVENLGQVAGALNIYVGSRENVIGNSVDLLQILKLFEKFPNINAKRLAYQVTLLANNFDPPTQYSAYDLRYIGNFAQSLKAFVEVVTESPRAAEIKNRIQSKCKFRQIGAVDSVDFQQFLQCMYSVPGLKGSPELKGLYQSFFAMMFTTAKDTQMSGMSIWYGTSGMGYATEEQLSDYRKLRFDRYAEWSKFIEWLSQ